MASSGACVADAAQQPKAQAKSAEASDTVASSPSDVPPSAPARLPAAAPAEQPEPDEVSAEGLSRQEVLMASLTIFVLAVFVGFEVITKVPPTLHTPLMSGSNAISGITIVGAIIVAGHQAGLFASVLGLLAVTFASINVVGGFLVTHRMLSMFKKR
jgi:NAD(P) transhydrogenase subunit alpha